MIIITGAAGFIGCNIMRALNRAGKSDIIAVDDLTNGHQYVNLAACDYVDYLDHEDFLQIILNDEEFAEPISAVFHQGACSDTTEWDGRYMMDNNYEYSKQLFNYCLRHEIPFIYASSAAVYGGNQRFTELDSKQQPLNVYGYSKWQFDRYMLRHLPDAQSQVVGLRYFNVYGPYEQHKANMASVAFHFMNQLCAAGEVRLFEGSHGYGDGEHLRDFIFVDDIANVNLWFAEHPNVSGIFNVGTGQARSFNDVAKTLIRLHGSGKIRYITFPDQLKQAYQAFTQAEIGTLRHVGYQSAFTSLEDGLAKYYRWYQDVLQRQTQTQTLEV